MIWDGMAADLLLLKTVDEIRMNDLFAQHKSENELEGHLEGFDDQEITFLHVVCDLGAWKQHTRKRTKRKINATVCEIKMMDRDKDKPQERTAC